MCAKVRICIGELLIIVSLISCLREENNKLNLNKLQTEPYNDSFRFLLFYCLPNKHLNTIELKK